MPSKKSFTLLVENRNNTDFHNFPILFAQHKYLKKCASNKHCNRFQRHSCHLSSVTNLSGFVLKSDIVLTKYSQ